MSYFIITNAEVRDGGGDARQKDKITVDEYGIMPHSVIVINGTTPETQNQN